MLVSLWDPDMKFDMIDRYGRGRLPEAPSKHRRFDIGLPMGNKVT